MTAADQLHLRALRMLTDGRRHAPRAVRWARSVTQPLRGADRDLVNSGDLSGSEFSLRELSLGASEVAAC